MSPGGWEDALRGDGKIRPDFIEPHGQKPIDEKPVVRLDSDDKEWDGKNPFMIPGELP